MCVSVCVSTCVHAFLGPRPDFSETGQEWESCFFCWGLWTYQCFNVALLRSLTLVFISDSTATCCRTIALALHVNFLGICLYICPCASACPTKVRLCCESPRLPKWDRTHEIVQRMFSDLFVTLTLSLCVVSFLYLCDSHPYFWKIQTRQGHIGRGFTRENCTALIWHCEKVMVTALTVNLRFPDEKASLQQKWSGSDLAPSACLTFAAYVIVGLSPSQRSQWRFLLVGPVWGSLNSPVES